MKKLLFILSLLIVNFSAGQSKAFSDISIDDLLTETQLSSDNTDYVEMIWWMPTEYWRTILSQDPSISQAEIDEIVALVEDYVFIAAVKGKIGMFGGVTFEKEDVVRKMLKVSYQDKPLNLLSESELNADLQNFITMMKPMMANMLGSMGENMHFLVLENKDQSKLESPIDPYSYHKLEFELGDFKKEIDLPLASLLEEKICPKTNKELNGKWNYCPIHGTELKKKKSF